MQWQDWKKITTILESNMNHIRYNADAHKLKKLIAVLEKDKRMKKDSDDFDDMLDTVNLYTIIV